MNIYIVLSYTGSLPSAIIKRSTGHEYSHVSVAVSDELDEMYSFGRIYTYFPWYGGFVREDISKGLFKRNKKAKIAVYKLEITKEDYSNLTHLIDEYSTKKSELFYDYFGAVGMRAGKNLFRENGYVCSSFAYELLNRLGVKLDKEAHVMFPIDFKGIDGVELVYEGLVSEYNKGKSANEIRGVLHD